VSGYKRGKRTELHKTGPPPKCHDCGKLLPSSTARLQVGGVWCCPDCAIQRERGAELPRLTRQRRRSTPQDETLPGL
jgi:ribosomal protein L37AE/L43A